MEERIIKLVDDTFINFEGEGLKKVIVDRILTYESIVFKLENKIADLQDDIDSLKRQTRNIAQGRLTECTKVMDLSQEEKDLINKFIEKRYKEELKRRRSNTKKVPKKTIK